MQQIHLTRPEKQLQVASIVIYGHDKITNQLDDKLLQVACIAIDEDEKTTNQPGEQKSEYITWQVL